MNHQEALRNRSNPFSRLVGRGPWPSAGTTSNASVARQPVDVGWPECVLKAEEGFWLRPTATWDRTGRHYPKGTLIIAEAQVMNPDGTEAVNGDMVMWRVQVMDDNERGYAAWKDLPSFDDEATQRCPSGNIPTVVANVAGASVPRTRATSAPRAPAPSAPARPPSGGKQALTFLLLMGLGAGGVYLYKKTRRGKKG